MENNLVEKFRSELTEELAKVEEELKTVGQINPDNPADWQPTPEKTEVLASDRDEVADSIEAFEDNTAILKQLEIRFNEIRSALQKIEGGKFGICETCGEKIEEARLEANPAAKTCKKHM
ncbi:MAG TPA: TraR/DksA C4-type zinc finger protein [Candidatus Paceibacterota bacterium]